MIDTITLRNFQSHKNSTLELCKGVNVIVGDSDTGKSAIIRSLYWTAFGKPAGTSIMRHSVVNPTIIEVTTEQGVLKKVRNERSGYYELNGTVFKGFGTAIPQPIISFLNLGEINFMRQLDPLFLLSKSGGELAQYLNKLINLDIIDSSLTNIKQSVNVDKNALAACEDNIQRLEKQLKDFEFVPEMEKAITQIEELEATHAKLTKMQKCTKQCVEIAKECRARLQKSNWVKAAQKLVASTEVTIHKLGALTAKQNDVRMALSRYKKAKRDVGSCQYDKQLEGAILGCSALHTKIKALAKREKILEDAINHVRYAVQQLNSVNELLQAAENEYAQVKPKICPTCGQPWRN